MIMQRIHYWLMRDAPPHSLALFRILFGAFQLLYWLPRLAIVREFSSNQALILPLTGITPPPYTVALLLLITLLLALACLTIGLATRTAAVISFALYAYHYSLSMHMFGGSFDRLFLFVLAVLCISRCDRAFSIAMWRKHGSVWAWEHTWIFPQRILAIQLTATYLGAGLQKLWLPSWQSGEVLSYSFISRWGTPLAFWTIRQNLPIWFYDGLVWATKFFEFVLPFGFWIKQLRWYMFVGGAVFHIFISLYLTIWWFMALVPAYVVFLEPEETLDFLVRVSKARISSKPS